MFWHMNELIFCLDKSLSAYLLIVFFVFETDLFKIFNRFFLVEITGAEEFDLYEKAKEGFQYLSVDRN